MALGPQGFVMMFGAPGVLQIDGCPFAIVVCQQHCSSMLRQGLLLVLCVALATSRQGQRLRPFPYPLLSFLRPKLPGVVQCVAVPLALPHKDATVAGSLALPHEEASAVAVPLALPHE